MGNIFERLEVAKNSAEAQYVLKQEGYPSRAYWNQVDVEMAKLRAMRLNDKVHKTRAKSKEK